MTGMCSDCLWAFMEVTLLERTRESVTKVRKCSLHGDMHALCPDYVKKPTQLEIIEQTKKDLKLDDFTIFFDEVDEDSFHLMSNEEKRNLCCVLCKCRPARELFSNVRKCPAFRSVVIDRLVDKMDIPYEEAATKYEILMDNTDTNIVEMERNAHEKSRGYLDFNILIAAAMYAARKTYTFITQFFSSNIFHVTETSLRNYLELV